MTYFQLLRLEDLPDEIILKDIYPYFSLEELYQTFVGLNQRLNNIIRSTIHLNFVVNNESITHPALISLKSSFACLTVCLGQFDIVGFTNIRALTLKYPSLQQRNAIRPKHFPFLKYLRLSYPIEDYDLLNVIFSGGFPCLKRCEFDRILTDHTWNGDSRIRFLQASVSGEYGITSLLRSCPNLSQLSIIVYDELQKNLVLPSYSISCESVVFLQNLFIRSRFEILVGIIGTMPNLRRLTFEDITKFLGRSDNSTFTCELLSNILRNLRQLSYLHFSIRTPLGIDRNSLHALYPSFRCTYYDGTCMIITSSDSINNNQHS